MRSRLLSCAAAGIVGVAAGLWQWTNDEGSSDAERIAALDGVAAVEHDPVHPYEITLDDELTTERLTDVLTGASSVLESTDDSAAYPMMFALTEAAEYYVDLSADPNPTAAIIASTEAADLAGADIDFDEDSRSQLTFRSPEDVLTGAQRLLSAFEQAGIDDLSLVGGHLELWYVDSSRDGYGPTIELDTSRTDVALSRLDTLAQTLRRSGADLLQADLGTGDQAIEVAVPSRARVESTARVFTETYGESHLDLTIDSGPQPPI